MVGKNRKSGPPVASATPPAFSSFGESLLPMQCPTWQVRCAEQTRNPHTPGTKYEQDAVALVLCHALRSVYSITSRV